MLDNEGNEAKVMIAIASARAVFNMLREAGVLKRDALAIRVFLIEEGQLFKDTFGNIPQENWDHPFDEIAEGKEAISLRTNLPSRIVQTIKRWLLKKDDVKFWGNDIEPGVVVASCSGVQPWIDELISKTAVNTYLALTEDDVEKAAQASPNSNWYNNS